MEAFALSFVYAEKWNDTFDIHCDTKIGLEGAIYASFTRDQAEVVKKYGIVKTNVMKFTPGCSQVLNLV